MRRDRKYAHFAPLSQRSYPESIGISGVAPGVGVMQSATRRCVESGRACYK